MASSFTTPLEIEYIDGRTFRVTKEFDYLVDFNDPNSAIRVPVGFVTDFASIPRVLWNILPPEGPYGKAAVVHDYLYVMGGRVPCLMALKNGLKASDECISTPPCKIYTKEQADRIFRDAMEVLGVKNPQRWVMWQAVRAFGRGNFKKVQEV